MCTDFTSLNKACTKDCYLLPCLERLVHGSTGHKVFDFMDTLRGYHQIIKRMKKNRFHYKIWTVLLKGNALRPKERKGNLLENG
ncbi:hypothetical protein LIER_10013 [Lithospermum erythrorhizon]|uniref:Reverse transcriptase n=1 Tax=Lithospermum erythrorhizon TaxID=34254 RepID=A0AAV3PMQ4_LITER